MKKAAEFILEAGMLKRTARSGWWAHGVKLPESVADHSFRTAVIGYILAKAEGADADKVMKMCLFHDMAEARISDMNKITRRYIDADSAEMKAANHQLAKLETGNEILQLIKEMTGKKTKEAIVAKDADFLEGLCQAVEYRDMGIRNLEEWIDNSYTALKTKSARKIADEIKKGLKWWEGLKNLDDMK